MTWQFDTQVIHAGHPANDPTGSVTAPIYQTSTFRQTEPGVNGVDVPTEGRTIQLTLTQQL